MPTSVLVPKGMKGLLPLSTFAFADKVPERINFLEHMLPYKGADDDLTLPWAVYGQTGLTTCSFYASHYARAKRKISLQLTVWYHIEGLGRHLTKLPTTIAETHGFLHTGRVATSLRSSVRDSLLEIAARSKTQRKMAALHELNWADLLIAEPQLVREYLRSEPGLQAIVHPVRQQLDPHQPEGLQIASFKLQRNHIVAAAARYFPEVIVEI